MGRRGLPGSLRNGEERLLRDDARPGRRLWPVCFGFRVQHQRGPLSGRPRYRQQLRRFRHGACHHTVGAVGNRRRPISKSPAWRALDSEETIRIDTGANLENADIATVGTAGATTTSAATAAGATVIPVASAIGFNNDQTITIDSGANSETAVIASVKRFPESAITVAKPLTAAHAAGAQVSGTGITLAAPLSREHASEAQVTGSVSTPGARNRYFRKHP